MDFFQSSSLSIQKNESVIYFTLRLACSVTSPVIKLMLYRIAGNLAEIETLTISLVDMKTRKFSPQESGSKVICSGHAHDIAAMHHNIVRATPLHIGLIVKV